jgi:hypothetical protein
MDRRKTYIFYVIGFFFILLLGVFFYFTFRLSGFNRFVAIFSPVNASLWENLKLGLWPAILFSLIEFIGYGFRNRNFFIAKAVSFYMIPILMVSFFYVYTLLLKRQELYMDIIIFVLSVLIAQTISYRVMVKRGRSSANARVFSFILILVIILAFTILTYYPLKLAVFMDNATNSYGIVNGS